MTSKILIFAILLSLPALLHSRVTSYTAADSTRVVEMLNHLKPMQKRDCGKLLLEAGKLFLGTPYVGGTLDREKQERLTIDIDEVDCSTFVDQALALALTAREGKCDFASFCRNLEKLRYRNGTCNGYDGRLHYFSWWVDDNSRRGIVRELTGKAFGKKATLSTEMSKETVRKFAFEDRAYPDISVIKDLLGG